MIKNQKQAGITRERLSELFSAQKSIKSDANRSELELQLATNSVEAMIEDLQEQLDTYESLVEGNFHCLQAKHLTEIPDVLISARLALKLSQDALGERLGLKGQQIQRYEATDYETASWPRIVEVATALGVELHFEKVIIINDSDNAFLIPDGMNAGQIEAAEEKLLECESLILC